MSDEETPQDDRQPEPTALRQLARRMRHVYKTRVRTTTVVLVVAFIALSVFYAFSSQHYYPETVKQPVRNVQQSQTTTDEPTPTVSETPTSTPETTSSTPTATEGSSPTTTSETNRPLFPNPFQPQTPTDETSVAPTTTPTGSGRP
ncbi:hypothetical protein [Gordonia phthalatica]|uniref:Uncharacterized protein n=1 Tax=Gordonia phthalatica TaxID=1136941 RepID=A0A0N9NI51_9ACTN|nr:hypothetical protein [Gordonia phthalatica]ALG85524.1 hypothetical protein ACH46_14900 [Gordonia phthalatica]